MSPIDRILPALSKVRRRQPNQWSACCPAHEDKGPSLSIRETAEGAVLLHCFAGCGVDEIAGALGIEMHELFPARDAPEGAVARTPRLLSPMQALEILHSEAQLVGVCAGNIAQGVTLTDADLARVLQAAGRIAYVRSGAMA